jgi:hypothetical protein
MIAVFLIVMLYCELRRFLDSMGMLSLYVVLVIRYA